MGLWKNLPRASNRNGRVKHCKKLNLIPYNIFDYIALRKLFRVKQFESGFQLTADGSTLLGLRDFLRKIESIEISLGVMPRSEERRVGKECRL